MQTKIKKVSHPKEFSIKPIFMALHWSFFVVLALLFISAIFFNRNTWFVFSDKSQIVCFLSITFVFMVSSCIVFFILKKSRSVSVFFEKNCFYVVYICMVVIFILQLIYTSFLYTNIGWDVGHIILNAKAQTADEQVWIDYFSFYPNNLVLLSIFKAVYNILLLFNNGEHFVRALTIINIIFVDASILLVFHLVKMIFDTNKAYVAWIFTIMMVAFFPWLIIPYSDTLSMPFTVGILFIYVKILKSKNWKHKAILSVLLGFIAQIGFLIKPTSIISFIAIMIVHLLTNINLDEKKRYDSKILLYAATSLIVGGFIFQAFIHGQSAIPFYDGVSFPQEHFIKMGMQKSDASDGRFAYGMYNADDFYYTASFPSTKEKQEADLEIIKERLSDFGFVGYIQFLVNKARWITGDGTFFWGGEGNFIEENFENITETQLQFRNLFYPNGSNYSKYAHVAQGIWLFIMFWIFLMLFLKKEYMNYYMNICMCTIIGIILFILIFEGRSRYLINHIPYFCVLSSYCFLRVFDSVRSLYSRYKSNA